MKQIPTSMNEETENEKELDIQVNSSQVKITSYVGVSAALLLPIILVATVFYIQNIFPFGSVTLLQEEILSIYSSFIEAFKTAVSRGNFFYTDQMGLGTNLWSLFSYYGMNPLNGILLLFPNLNIHIGLMILFTIRAAFSGAAMFLFLRKVCSAEIRLLLPLSAIYSVGGHFMLSYQHVFWADIFWLFPLLLWAFCRMLDRENSWLFSLSLFGICMSSFSVLYTVVLFLPCILLFLYGIWKRKNRADTTLASDIQHIFRFGFVGFFAGAVFWLPIIYSFFLQGVPLNLNHISIMDPLQFTFFEFLQSLCMPVTNQAEYLVFTHVSVLFAIFLPVYILCKEISSRRKIQVGLILILLYFSGNVTWLNWFWNLFPALPSQVFRQSFFTSFILIMEAGELLSHLKSTSEKQWIGSGLTVGCICVFARQVNGESMDDLMSVLMVVLVAAYTLIFTRLSCSKKKKAAIEQDLSKDEFLSAVLQTSLQDENMQNLEEKIKYISVDNKKTVWSTVLLFMIFFEAVFFSSFLMSNIREEGKIYEKMNVPPLRTDVLSTYRSINEENSVASGNVAIVPELTGNDGIWYQFPSVSAFSGALSPVYAQIAKGLGVWSNGYSFVKADGVNEASGAILRITDKIILTSETDETDEMSIENNLYRNFPVTGLKTIESGNENHEGILSKIHPSRWNLMQIQTRTDSSSMIFPMGFLVSREKTGDLYNTEKSPFLYSNQMYKDFGFSAPYSPGTVEILSGANMNSLSLSDFTMEREGLDVTFTIQVLSDQIGEDLYLYVDSDQELELSIPERVLGASTEKGFDKFIYKGSSRMVYLGVNDGEPIQVNGTIRQVKNEHVYFYAGTLNTTVIETAVKEAEKNAAQLKKTSSSTYDGNIECEEDGEIVFLIPYDAGWKIKIDGKNVENVQNNGFLSVFTVRGYHTIEMSFTPSGFLPGLILSVLAIFGIVVLGYVEKSKKLRSTKELKCSERR